MNYTQEIEKKRRELAELERKQAALVSNCQHKWEPAFLNPEEYMREYLTGEYEVHGVDRWPKSAFIKDYKNRWTRTCSKCGLEQHTYNLKPIQYEPEFK
jgi:hypothetical protein